MNLLSIIWGTISRAVGTSCDFLPFYHVMIVRQVSWRFAAIRWWFWGQGGQNVLPKRAIVQAKRNVTRHNDKRCGRNVMSSRRNDKSCWRNVMSSRQDVVLVRRKVNVGGRNDVSWCRNIISNRQTCIFEPDTAPYHNALRFISVSHITVGLAQARPNKRVNAANEWAIVIFTTSG